MDINYWAHNINFIWNKEKARQNLRKHGVSFQQAAEAFFDPFLKMVEAGRSDEEREAIIGMDRKGSLLFVVHLAIEEETIRLISARKATVQERLDYENG